MIRFAVRLSMMFALSIAPASAASIRVVSQHAGEPAVLALTGEIVTGDDGRLREVLGQVSGRSVLRLDSPGGQIGAAILLGEIVNSDGIITEVVDDGLCASACALVWLSGSTRRLHEGGRIGFHESRSERGNRGAGLGNAMVGIYLSRLGYDLPVVDLVLSTPYNAITYLEQKHAFEHGLAFDWIPEGDDLPMIDATGASQFVTEARFFQAKRSEDGTHRTVEGSIVWSSPYEPSPTGEWRRVLKGVVVVPGEKLWAEIVFAELRPKGIAAVLSGGREVGYGLRVTASVPATHPSGGIAKLQNVLVKTDDDPRHKQLGGTREEASRGTVRRVAYVFPPRSTGGPPAVDMLVSHPWFSFNFWYDDGGKNLVTVRAMDRDVNLFARALRDWRREADPVVPRRHPTRPVGGRMADASDLPG